MAKLKQISIKFNYKQEAGTCGICNEEKPVVEVGDIAKLAICDVCAQQIADVHTNMKLMRTAG